MIMHPFVIVFIIVWLSGVALAGIVFAVQQFNEGKFHPSTLVVVIMFAFMYGLTMGAFKYESKKSKMFLANLFDAEEINN
jgi:hypothetical protein